MGHAVEGRTANEGLRPLRLHQTGRQIVAEDGLEAKHCGFCQRTDMITRGLLPILTAVLANVAQIFVARVRRRFGIAMLPDVGILAWRDQDFRLGSMLMERVVDLALIITAIVSSDN